MLTDQKEDYKAINFDISFLQTGYIHIAIALTLVYIVPMFSIISLAHYGKENFVL